MAEVISFPKSNPRAEETLTTEDIIQKKRNLKINFFKDAADDIVENIVRDIASLELSTITNGELAPLQPKDIIMLRESLLSIMCRLTVMDHPLHDIVDELIVSEETFDEYGEPMYGYSFKDKEK